MNKVWIAFLLIALSCVGLYILFASIIFVVKVMFYTCIAAAFIVGVTSFVRRILKN